MIFVGSSLVSFLKAREFSRWRVIRGDHGKKRPNITKLNKVPTAYLKPFLYSSFTPEKFIMNNECSLPETFSIEFCDDLANLDTHEVSKGLQQSESPEMPSSFFDATHQISYLSIHALPTTSEDFFTSFNSPTAPDQHSQINGFFLSPHHEEYATYANETLERGRHAFATFAFTAGAACVSESVFFDYESGHWYTQYTRIDPITWRVVETFVKMGSAEMGIDTTFECIKRCDSGLGVGEGFGTC
ncbi:hypothetical protein BC829DRAFT_441958 [Chytridium lagenaria]|nr:hypothetical protein BC829DRAFT_441958 [Chytridium lagenaria]